jgi:hypothetical protein
MTFTWYLPAVLLSWIPGSYNAFVIAGYVLAAWFAYLFAFELTAKRLAGWIAGILYGSGGFLMAHVGHPTIVHTAAWIPAVLLALERNRGAASPAWFVFGCLAAGQLVLGGDPQTIAYGFVLAAAYAGVRGYSTGSPCSYYVRAALLLCFGIGLGSVLLLPLFELTSLSVRHALSFEAFSLWRFPLHSLGLLFFPYLYGADWGSIYGEQFYVDITHQGDAFLGFLTLSLATYAFSKRKQAAPVSFLFGAAVLALLCSFGGDTFVGQLVFRVPPFYMFRCQSCFLVIFQLAMAVLAGIGVSRLNSGISTRRALVQAGVLLLLEVAAALTISLAQGPSLRRVAASRGIPNVSFAIKQPTFLVPLVCAAVAVSAILLLGSRARAATAVVLSLAALADMGQFGLFGSWRYADSSRRELDSPPTAELLRPLGGRTLAVSGQRGGAAELPPNRSKLWGIESLNQYEPLAVERYSLLTGIDTGGMWGGPRWNFANRALDILGARWILTPDADIGEMERFQGIPVPAEDLNEELGEGAAQQPETVVSFAVDKDKRFTSLALVSFLRGSAHVPLGTPVLQLRLRAESGLDRVIPVLAGRDTGEFLTDCITVPGVAEHAPITVFRTVSAETSGGNCPGNFYFGQWPVPVGQHWSSLEAKWLGSHGGIDVAKLVLWNRDTGQIQAVSPEDSLAGRFRLVARKQLTRIYENRRAMPRAWLASQALRLDAESVKQAIQTSTLPDGTTFNPSTTALVEDSVDLPGQAPDKGASAVVTRAENTLVEVRTTSRQPGLVVLGDLYYPGWRATVNGRAARVLRTNFVQRGVAVPAGDNVVRFTFRPGSLYLGIGMALMSIAGIALACARGIATAKPVLGAGQPR